MEVSSEFSGCEVDSLEAARITVSTDETLTQTLVQITKGSRGNVLMCRE